MVLEKLCRRTPVKATPTTPPAQDRCTARPTPPALHELCGRMQTQIGKDIDKAAALLKEGRSVAIPTETVYGLAANAFDAEAVLNIFAAKERPAFDPLIVHVPGPEALDRIVLERPLGTDDLIAAFWPGPLTLVLPKRPEVPDVVTSGLDTVGVRMPGHPMALELLRALPFPLAAPSANPFGYVSPTSAEHVLKGLGGRIPYILDGGPCTVGVESTILGFQDGHWMIYRQGGVAQERIERVIGAVKEAGGRVIPVAPGMLESHYAPGTPLHVGDIRTLSEEAKGRRIAVISFTKDHAPLPTRVLSRAGDLSEAARELFAALRACDAGGYDVILAERFPETGLGRAINDRLKRAAVKRA